LLGIASSGFVGGREIRGIKVVERGIRAVVAGMVDGLRNAWSRLGRNRAGRVMGGTIA
jgi:hypothetical protein